MRLARPAFRRDTAWSICSFAVYAALGAVQAIAIARHLGPEAKGYVSILILGPTVVGWLLSLGLTPATMYLAGGARETVARLFTMSAFAAAVLGAAGAVVTIFVVGPLVEDRGDVYRALVLGVVLLPTLLLRESYGAVLVGIGEIVAFSKASMVARILSVGLVVLATYASPPAWFFAAVSASLGISNVVVVFWAACGRFRWNWSPDTLRMQIRYGLRSHIGGISELGALRFDQFVVFAAAGAAQLGFYSSAVFVSEILILFAYATTTVTFGRLSGASPDHALRLSRLTVMAVSAALGLAAIPIMVLAEPVMRFLFGPGFAVAASALSLLTLAAMVQGVGRVAVSALRALGHPLLSSLVHLLGLGASVPLVLWLVPAYGIVGAAAASLASYGVTTVLAVAWLWAPRSRVAIR